MVKIKMGEDKMNMEDCIRKKLFALQDIKYRDFSAKLIPTIDKDRVIGVRTPALRQLAKEVVKLPEMIKFVRVLPHYYHEENSLHAAYIETIKDYEQCMEEIERFLPYIDNWAICDSLSPKILKKHLPELLEKIREWIEAEHIYTVRFGIGMLMRYYLADDTFSKEYPELISKIRTEEYYINMMTAWYFATALAKQWDDIIPYIEQRKLDKWTHHKAIQKAVESRRIADVRKEYLKSLRY